MDQQKVPVSIHWLIPIADKLLELHFQDKDFSLSEEDRAFVSQHLTREVRIDIEEWIDTSDTNEASRFNLVMILLDELDLLEATEPTLDYNHRRSNLTSSNWGKVGIAARTIATEYLSNLDKQQLTELDCHVESLLRTVTNENSRIWLTWLRSQINKNIDIGRCFLREIIKNKHLEDDHLYDLREHAAWALVTMPHVSTQDLDCVIVYIVDPDTDEYEAAVVLEKFLCSVYVPVEMKRRALDLARDTMKEKLLDLANEYGL